MSVQGIEINTYYELYTQCKLERDLLKQELQKTRERHEKCMISFGIKLTEVQDKHDELLNELQKAREQLEKAEKVIQFYSEGYVIDQANHADDDDADCVNAWSLYTGKRARQYFKDKENRDE